MSDNQPPNYDPNNSGGYGQAPQFGAGGAYGGAGGQAHPQGTMILVLGILSLVCCGIFTGIPAIIMGSKAKKEIAASPGMYNNAGQIQAGWICGIISAVFSVIGIIFYVIVFATAAGTGSMS